MTEKLIKSLGEEVGVGLPDVRISGVEPGLPSVFRLATAAAVSVGAVTAAVARYKAPERTPREVSVDVRHAAAAFMSERHFRIDGEEIGLWAPLSGDYRTSDGWVRLHCNFDHHREAALRALRLPPDADRDAVSRACESRTSVEIEDAVIREDGCAAAMRSRKEWLAHPQAEAVARTPLVALSRLDSTGPSPDRAARTGSRPLDGVRVLDLTRVIAGPVAARILAAHGAEVLRVGAAHLPEVPGLVVETAFGKRSCHIDLRTEADTLRELVRQADVVIQAYRPGSLAERGFGPEELAGLRPGVVCVEISAYGSRGPWGRRRGFDSLVQMACGIAHEGGDGTRPSPLPCQALDHATGYLAAFGAVAGLLRRRDEGGSWRVELSLARTARWLDELGRIDRAESADGEPGLGVDDLLERMDSAFGPLTYVRPPGRIEGAEPYWASPPPRPGEHLAGWATATG
ncbi:CoA transferase [Microtetraspora fusca]|uniref:CoA transferase n=1 Tax=Microtetraspora fusca TaxID=1997 RepID=A0ABW6VM05_MICFU